MFTENQISKFKETPTPFYYYDLALLDDTLAALKSAMKKFDYKVHYSLKANTNDEILQHVLQFGLGADCVSGNEVQKALELGFHANEVVYAGVGKTDSEIEFAISKQIFCFNCESLQEIEVINEIAVKLNLRAKIAIRINPNVDAKTIDKITTGRADNKFGIDYNELVFLIDNLCSYTNIDLIGLHFHIGSQILDLSVYKNLCLAVNQYLQWFENNNVNIKHINMGGGLGLDYYNPDVVIHRFDEFFSIVHENLDARKSQTVHFELGRSVVGQCGTLITKVLYIKDGRERKFAIVDAGFTDLLRPALYNSYHKIENLTSTKANEIYDVVGPICESTDTFGRLVELPQTKRGDLIAIRTAGAYGQVMASQYNMRQLSKAYYS